MDIPTALATCSMAVAVVVIIGIFANELRASESYKGIVRWIKRLDTLRSWQGSTYWPDSQDLTRKLALLWKTSKGYWNRTLQRSRDLAIIVKGFLSALGLSAVLAVAGVGLLPRLIVGSLITFGLVVVVVIASIGAMKAMGLGHIAILGIEIISYEATCAIKEANGYISE